MTGPAWLPWRIVDVSSWQEGPDETRGLRAKRWLVAPDGIFWLRKSPRPRSPYEPAIECLALRLAAASRLEAAEAYPCVWLEDEEEHRGILVRSFLTHREALHSGEQILKGHFSDYDPQVYSGHTIPRAVEALRALEAEPGVLVRPFLRVLAYDMVIGNGDRHQRNWSVIVAGDVPRLSPMYDPAACLGVELQDGHRLLSAESRDPEMVHAYAHRCPSGFGNGRRFLAQRELAAELKEIPEWVKEASVVRSAVRLALQGLPRFVEQVPDDWYPEERRRLGRLLLEHRLDTL